MATLSVTIAAARLPRPPRRDNFAAVTVALPIPGTRSRRTYAPGRALSRRPRARRARRVHSGGRGAGTAHGDRQADTGPRWAAHRWPRGRPPSRSGYSDRGRPDRRGGPVRRRGGRGGRGGPDRPLRDDGAA